MNAQTRQLSKKGLCTINGGPTTQVQEVKHGNHAFMPPDKAIRWKKENGVHSWRVNKNHPNNVPIGKR